MDLSLAALVLTTVDQDKIEILQLFMMEAREPFETQKRAQMKADCEQLQKKFQHFFVIACISWLFNCAEFTLIDCIDHEGKDWSFWLIVKPHYNI